jgi:hypothetical protein
MLLKETITGKYTTMDISFIHFKYYYSKTCSRGNLELKEICGYQMSQVLKKPIGLIYKITENNLLVLCTDNLVHCCCYYYETPSQSTAVFSRC